MAVCAYDLAEGCGKYRCVGKCLLYTSYHTLEALDFIRQILTACLRAFDSKSELEVLLVSDQYVRNPRNFRKSLTKLFLTVFPE